MGPDSKAVREHKARIAKDEAQRKATARKGGETGSDLESKTVEELASEAERRKITVVRGDGKDGDPLKADYIAALSSGR